MARQKGALKYVGTLGDVRHFKIKGQEGYFAGLVGGPTGEQVKTAAEFERTRENMNEFGGCAKAGKSVRTALSGLIKAMADSQVTGRLTSIMKKINLEDGTEARGYRKIEITSQRQYLQGFEFDRNLSFSSVVNVDFETTHQAARNSADLVLPAFTPMNALAVPPGATHCRFVNAIAVISDFQYNVTTDSYEPIDPDLNELSKITFSAYIPVDVAFAGTSITAALTGAPVMSNDVSVLQVIGIEFSQKVGTDYYAFASGNCMQIVEIF
ncbi:MAG TPA: hypothetical protein DCL43_11205 [Chitinophagaceae bacterium]|nr:hypothetical protein [Chitinophagaceae bacterium]